MHTKSYITKTDRIHNRHTRIQHIYYPTLVKGRSSTVPGELLLYTIATMSKEEMTELNA